MSIATTFRLEVPKILPFPVSYYPSTTGPNQPITLMKVGEMVDLERVDVKSFVKAMFDPAVTRLVEKGTLAKVQVDVSEKRGDMIRAEIEALRLILEKKGLSSANRPYGGQVAVISIEPGLQVAVGGGAVQLAPPVSDPIPPVGAQEHQMTGEAALAVPVIVVPEVPAAAPQVEPVVEEAVPEVVVSWKDNLTLDQQKKIVTTSEDQAFLQAVLDDSNEPKQLKKLAKVRLTELKK